MFDTLLAHSLHLGASLPMAGLLPDFAAIQGWLSGLGLWQVWGFCFGILLLCGFGLPIPEDVTLIICGYSTYQLNRDGHLGNGWQLVATAIVISLAGVLIGDATMFTLGRKLGQRLMVRKPFSTILGGGRYEKAVEFLEKRGPHVLFSARFMPGLRSAVFFTSGTLGIKMRTFLYYDGLAALLSVPALVGCSWYFGEEIHVVEEWAKKSEMGILGIIIAVALIALGKWWWGQRKKAPGADDGLHG